MAALEALQQILSNAINPQETNGACQVQIKFGKIYSNETSGHELQESSFVSGVSYKFASRALHFLENAKYLDSSSPWEEINEFYYSTPNFTKIKTELSFRNKDIQKRHLKRQKVCWVDLNSTVTGLSTNISDLIVDLRMCCFEEQQISDSMVLFLYFFFFLKKIFQKKIKK